MKFRILLLVLLVGASLAGAIRYADVIAREPAPEAGQASVDQPAPDEPSAVDPLPLPAFPVPGPSDPLLAQAHVIPPLPLRTGAFTTRSLPPEKLTIPSIAL